ncbi:MAG TPA: tetratricopeptide repeat protein [Methylomirabilota bacterium]
MTPLRVLLLLVLGWPAAAGAQGEVSPALRAYVQGLDHIRQGRYADAVAPLGQAAQLVADPMFVLAHGVALCLGERFGEAIADFERAKRGGLKGREADLWTYAAQMMSNGRERSGLDNKGPGGRGWFGGAPGHVIQGRDDYPTDYASFVYYEMATPYAQGVTPAVREAMRQAGAWFANRAATRADLAPAHLARARELYGQGAYPAVLDELTFVRAVYPASAEVHGYGGAAWLALGRSATARRELTIALTAATRSPSVYAARALAAARLGDGTRARADLETAARYDAAVAGRSRAQVEQAIGTAHADGQPEALLAALESGARAGAPLEALIGQASTLHRALAPRRLRYDEWYQDRLREREDAQHAAPKAAGPYVEIARFLIDEANLAYRGEDVEPRHGPQPFRWQASRQAELRRAVTLCDEALTVQPGDLEAETVKAIALVRLGDEAAAEQIVNRVLGAAPKHPQALRLRAKFLLERASALDARAAALRAPRVETNSYTETRSDGVYRVTETRYYPPTGDALNQAAQLEAQAAQLVRASQAALAAALAVLRNTFEGDMMQAEVDFASGRQEAAFAALQSALRRQPRSLEANQTLAEFQRRLGRVDESDRQMSLTTNLVHTNAGWLLRIAWRKTMGHDVPAARAALDEARRLDPTDARVPAYTGALLAQDGQAAEAAARYRVAIALEQARLRMDEGKDGTALPREAEELAALMKMRNVLAAGLLERQPQAALDYYLPNTALARRITRGGRAAQMFGAMLPDPSAPAVPVPAPPNAASLMAEAYNGAGRAYKALGRTQEAAQQYQAAIELTRKLGVPGVGSGRPGDTNFGGNAQGVTAESFIEVIRAALARGDCQNAAQTMSRATEARFPPDRREEANRLQFEIARCFQSRR